MTHTYLIALGGNMRHARYGGPGKVLASAIDALDSLGSVRAFSRIIGSAAIGPSQRRFANAALVLAADIAPDRLLAGLKKIERNFGKRGGQRWSARVLDLDIILWSGGIWASPGLSIPHTCFRERGFVLGLAAEIAPDWRDPISSLSVRQLNARLTKPRPIPSGRLR
ncbi:2-amino-4-hydroxy-6-hydroxymethyldihydropteridine diphosphokinase [Pontixanthobacter aquaemixtae]|uniref:2-amino-4-hydroxy-6-hydroxymethyldihydropteridine pyrophosphokinase n=1 Tax=Pontixanthobacter aquaemixtae TaxID=1958940 RepID=A0A844ZR12_9SPHN|nr:2-amino-4-hydroxy-6-hydroxymethyldihydropteridine diphosphokinase [Pontixanthobacter aquaemixtae]MXO89247.1 2-amino-4-hydroxy-6-hydroxymethyldihydropteridine diphosphokinase [Pontixanthobacter aquaemixtae]